MRQRRQLGQGSPAYYGTAQPVNFMDSVGNFFGNLGNSWQGGEDAAMYGGNPQGDPYATTTGAYTAGAATKDAAVYAVQAIGAPITGFLSGMLRGGGVILGAGIILVVLLNAHDR